jgi:hypothetical protein
MEKKEELFQLVNKAGYEAYQLIEQRVQGLGPMDFMDFFTAVMGAASVCLANALRPGIEAGDGKERAAIADKLIASSMRQVRALVEPAVREES